MRVLVDIAHPAHVHFFKHIMWGLTARAHDVQILARDKDVTHDLLEHHGFSFLSVGQAGDKTATRRLSELVQRDWMLWKMSRLFRPHIILTRNPAGVQVARLVGARGVFDTDDGYSAKTHFHAAAPFAHFITTPDCSREDLGRKQVRYPGYKQLAYLHPDHYVPEPDTRKDLGLAPDEDFCIVRFVAMTAIHDRGETGLSNESKHEIVRRLSRVGRVFISSESPLPRELQGLAFPLAPHRMHDALAFARLYVGDSQSMAAEAAVLGTPAIQISTFAHRLDYLRELEARYNLVFAFCPSETGGFLQKIDAILASTEIDAQMRDGRAMMLRAKCNVATWFIHFLEQMALNNRDRLRSSIATLTRF